MSEAVTGSELVLVTPGKEYLDQLMGQRLRDRADRKTAFRSNFSPILGMSVAMDNGEHPLHAITNTGVTAYMEWTDFTDGHDARVGAELLGEEPTVEGGEADQKADKRKFYSQITGLAMRYLIQDRNLKQGLLIAGNGVVQGFRDIEMQKARDAAIEEGIPANARNIGKYKTVTNGLALGLHTLAPALPEKIQPLAKKTGNILLGAGSALSLAGLIDMKLHISKSKGTEAAEVNNCPDFFEQIS